MAGAGRHDGASSSQLPVQDIPDSREGVPLNRALDKEMEMEVSGKSSATTPPSSNFVLSGDGSRGDVRKGEVVHLISL